MFHEHGTRRARSDSVQNLRSPRTRQNWDSGITLVQGNKLPSLARKVAALIGGYFVLA